MIATDEAQGSKLRNASFELLRYDLLTRPPGVTTAEIRLLIGTDEEIGTAENTPEQRVAIVPSQVRDLVQLLSALAVKLEVAVMSGAGERAGYTDRDYAKEGCRIITRDAFGGDERFAPHLLLSLKEPSVYEGDVPGQFLRVGALHWPLYEAKSGLHRLLERRSFAAIFDGGGIGSSGADLLHGGYPTPIVSSMGYYAGFIAAQEVMTHYRGPAPLSDSKVVVGGGGAAGVAAAKQLLGKCREIVIIELSAERSTVLESLLQSPRSSISNCETRTVVRIVTADLMTMARHEIADAAGAILCLRVKTEKARELLDDRALRAMAPGAVVVDIPIDQGGSILNPNLRDKDTIGEKIVKNARMLRSAGLTYVAEVNLPRREPRDASHIHGEAVLPYAACLLAACAEAGDVTVVARGLASRIARKAKSLHEVRTSSRAYREWLLDDLRNGLAFTNLDGRLGIHNQEIVTHEYRSRFQETFAGEG